MNQFNIWIINDREEEMPGLGCQEVLEKEFLINGSASVLPASNSH